MLEKVTQATAFGQATMPGSAKPTAVADRAAAASGDQATIKKARSDFTAMVLQDFLDAAVPEDLSGGADTSPAAGMWRSLLVEQLAKSLAASGQFNVFNDVADQRLVAPEVAPSVTQRTKSR